MIYMNLRIKSIRSIAMDRINLDSNIVSACKKCNSLKDINSKEFKNNDELWIYLKSKEEDLDRKLDGCTNLNEQMQLLHDYNDIKDLTQSVFGRLANILDMSVSEVHKKFDLHDVKT